MASVSATLIFATQKPAPHPEARLEILEHDVSALDVSALVNLQRMFRNVILSACPLRPIQPNAVVSLTMAP